MTPVWRKLGLVFQPAGDTPWRLSHAATPTAEVLSGSQIRVYFTSRDAQNRSHISTVELDLRTLRTSALSGEPLVAPGAPGAFDQDGAAMGCFVRDGSRRLLYYMGWRLAQDVPWRNAIGLALAEGDSGEFVKVGQDPPASGLPGDGVGPSPILPLNDVDPHSMSYPWVMRDGDRWRMWYGSNLAWGEDERSMRHVIKYAESVDGTRWARDGEVAIPMDESAGEFAVARPCVLRDKAAWRMWFSCRKPSYRMGYAESADGRSWTRRDADVGVTPGPPGTGQWDSESVQYACVFDAGGDRWMLYNGNDYGRAGFGLAVRER